MITNFRSASKKVLRPLAYALVRAGLTGNQMTALGLLTSFIYLLVILLTKNVLLSAVLLSISSLLDALDGEVARMRGSAGPRGSFLDSTFDRIEDTVFISSLVLLGFHPLLTSLSVGVTLTISYRRAKAESLGIKAEGRGLVERGERLILVFLILVLYPFFFDASLALYYLLLLGSLATVVQRFHLIFSAVPK